jgi:hypothetical protein
MRAYVYSSFFPRSLSLSLSLSIYMQACLRVYIGMLAKGMLACVLREGVCPCIQQQKLLNPASTANYYTCVLLLFA